MPQLPDDFSLQEQHGDNLCWLAVAASVADFHSGNAGGQQQCDLAQHLVPNLLAGTNCCPPNGTPPKVPSECDEAGELSKVLKHISHYASESSSLATFADIEQEILANNPVALALRFTNLTHHAVAVVDAYTDATGDVLVILDPTDVTQEIQYDYGTSDLGGYQNISFPKTFFTKK